MKLEWERIDDSTSAGVYRAKVFGGWLIMATDDVITPVNTGYSMPEYHQGYEWRTSITFVPDLKHEWK